MPKNVDAAFLFPTPSAHPSALSPYHWPGVSPESTQALKDVLRANHERWHIFFNDKRFHNHTAHRALAIWALGADPAVIRAAYDHDCKEQRPAYKSPQEITEHNFEEHLSDERYYDAYLNFFTDQVRAHGIDKTLEKFIFSRKYNVGKKAMLGLFLAGLLHPMIHTGYGAEFDLPGIFIEGLAQACVHRPDVYKLLPISFFESIYSISDKILANTPNSVANATRKVEQIAGHLGSGASIGKEVLSAAQGGNNVHALTILARVMADSTLDLPQDHEELTAVQGVIDKHADRIRDYASQWTIDIQRSGEVDRKVEEIAWMNTVMYGIAGWTWAQKVKHGKDGEFNADFFLAHLVTSPIFLPSLLARVRHSPHSQILLLRSYMAVCLSWYIARGRPELDIPAFFTSSTATAYPLPVNSLPTPHKDALPGQDTPQARIPDPWFPLVQTTLVHPDEHLPKAVRALATWASKFGTTPAGTFAGPSQVAMDKGAIKTELPGAEYLDGTLFVRVAGLTVARMGRVGQGEAAAEFWDRTGFYG